MAQFGIQVREGFVHQEDIGISYQCPAYCHTLLLTIAYLAWQPFQQVVDPQQFGNTMYFFVNGRVVFLIQRTAQRGCNILINCHVRIQRIVFKHHGHIAMGRINLVHDLAVELDQSFFRQLDASNVVQQCCLSGACRSEQNEELIILDLKINVVEGIKFAETFGYIQNFNLCHFLTLSLHCTKA